MLVLSRCPDPRVQEPELLFLDELTVGFDPQARREFHGLVLRLADQRDTTVLLITYDLAAAEKLADRIFILNDGRIVADGTADELAATDGEYQLRQPLAFGASDATR